MVFLMAGQRWQARSHQLLKVEAGGDGDDGLSGVVWGTWSSAASDVAPVGP